MSRSPSDNPAAAAGATEPARLGEFTVTGVLGEGGSATVYDARWGHRSIALKVVRADLGEADRRRFLDEARLLIEMAHPGVVKALAAGTLPDGRTYLAMEKLPGVTLAQRLAHGPIPLASAVQLFEQLCDAVAAMHAAGLVHRDLKPENVMLVSDGGMEHAVLLDFGIAKAMTDGVATLTNTGQVRGTPAYMAPERFFGSPASVATDVYELAVTFFAMIAGRLPWDDDADAEVRLNPARLRDVADVPPALDELVARALSTRAGNRPAEVIALRDGVRAASGVAVGQGGPGAPSRVTAPVPVPLLPTLPAAGGAVVEHARTAGSQPWRRAGGAVTTGSAASGERIGGDTTGTSAAVAPPRKRWPLVVATVAIAGAASTATVIVLGETGGGGRGAVTVPRADDPWDPSAKPVGPVALPSKPAVEELTAARRDALRDAMSGALLHHAPDASAIATLSLAELRADPALARVLASTRESALFHQAASLFFGMCDVELGRRGDWVSFAVVNEPGGEAADYDLIASGAWTRDELEPCLARGRKGAPERRALPGGAKGAEGAQPLTWIPVDDDGQLVLWLDDHTFFTTTRPITEANGAWMAARLRASRAKPSPLDTLGARLDRHASAWVVGRREAMAVAIDDPDLQADLAARLVVDEDGAAATASLYLRDAAAAEVTHAKLEAELAKLTDDVLVKAALPDLASATREGEVVRLRARLPSGLLEKLGDEMIKALP